MAADLPESFFELALSDTSSTDELLEAVIVARARENESITKALLVRYVHAVDRIVRQMPKDLALLTLAAPSDFGALARALSDPRMAAPSLQTDPLAGAVGRSIAHRRRLAEMAGEMLSSAQVEDLLGIKRQAIDKRRQANKLLAVRMAADWAYPAFQFGQDGVLPGLEDVLKAHADEDPWVILDILLAPDTALGGRSLLEALQDGDADAVARHVAQTSGDGYA